MIEAIGPNKGVCKSIRELEDARIQLQNTSEREGRERAKTVITKLANVLRRLVDNTDLVQEEDLHTAIEIAIVILNNIDTHEAFEAGRCGDSD